MSGNASDAEDLAQETFLQAMQSWHRFDERSQVETWLYGILLNLDRKRKRSHVRRWRRITVWFARRSSPDDPSPSQSTEELETRDCLWSAVRELPDVQQQAIILRYAEGLTYDEVAQVMGCPCGTVKSRLHHGLHTLRIELKKKGSSILDEISYCGEEL